MQTKLGLTHYTDPVKAALQMVALEVSHPQLTQAFETDESRCNLDLPRRHDWNVHRRPLNG